MKKIYTMIILAVCFTAGTLAQTEWVKHAEPVFLAGAGSWDEAGLGTPEILLIDGTYHMWYSGGLWDTEDGETGLQIGHATSVDGITWEADENNPVITAGEDGSIDGMHAYMPIVEYDGSTYHMYYIDMNASGNEDPGYATSVDGVNWTKNPDKLVYKSKNGDPYSKSIKQGDVFYDGEKFHMWTNMRNGYTSVGYANSDDGFTWVVQDSIVMNSSYDWYYPRTQVATVIELEHPDIPEKYRYHMWYSGGGLFDWDIGYAWSDDGLNWTRYGEEPVLARGTGDEWDASSVSFPTILFDEDEDIFKMWYGGAFTGTSGAIGYAEADITVDVIKQIAENNLKIYPNPAKNFINIETRLPGDKTFKIYNVTGQVLFHSILNNMNSKVDVSSLKKGMYLITLEGDQQTETTKLFIE